MSSKSRHRMRELQVCRQSIPCTGCCHKECPVTDLPSCSLDHQVSPAWRMQKITQRNIRCWCPQVCQVVWCVADELIVGQQTQFIADSFRNWKPGVTRSRGRVWLVLRRAGLSVEAPASMLVNQREQRCISLNATVRAVTSLLMTSRPSWRRTERRRRRWKKLVCAICARRVGASIVQHRTKRPGCGRPKMAWWRSFCVIDKLSDNSWRS